MAVPQSTGRIFPWQGISYRAFLHTWDLVQLLTVRELKLRYQGTALGYFWSLARPLLFALVLYIAVGRIIRINIPHYHLFLLSGLFPWTWFQASVFLAAPSFANNGNLLKKVYFPRFVLPLSTVTNNFVHFALSLPVLAVLLLVAGKVPNANWLIGLPLLVLLQLLLLMGVVLIVATVDVFFRDLEHLVDVGLYLLFYLTPVLYPLAMVPSQLRPLMHLNPLAPLIEAWRDLFLENRLPDFGMLWPTLLFTACVLPASIWLFRALEEHFEDAL